MVIYSHLYDPKPLTQPPTSHDCPGACSSVSPSASAASKDFVSSSQRRDWHDELEAYDICMCV